MTDEFGATAEFEGLEHPQPMRERTLLDDYVIAIITSPRIVAATLPVECKTKGEAAENIVAFAECLMNAAGGRV